MASPGHDAHTKALLPLNTKVWKLRKSLSRIKLKRLKSRKNGVKYTMHGVWRVLKE